MISSERFTGWRKSSYSGGGNGECLEVADGHPVVPVRDSKRPQGPRSSSRPLVGPRSSRRSGRGL